MVKTLALEEIIKSAGYKKGYLCECLGISRQAFHKKMNNGYPFRAAEIFTLCYLLHIDEEEKNEIFFAEEVNP